jgi:hypothetical protein
VNWHERDGLGAGDDFNPSSSWSCGGPILQSACISVFHDAKTGWRAGFDPQAGAPGLRPGPTGEGPTPLVACMRAYVASRLGDTVDLDH